MKLSPHKNLNLKKKISKKNKYKFGGMLIVLPEVLCICLSNFNLSLKPFCIYKAGININTKEIMYFSPEPDISSLDCITDH